MSRPYMPKARALFKTVHRQHPDIRKLAWFAGPPSMRDQAFFLEELRHVFNVLDLHDTRRVCPTCGQAGVQDTAAVVQYEGVPWVFHAWTCDDHVSGNLRKLVPLAVAKLAISDAGPLVDLAMTAIAEDHVIRGLRLDELQELRAEGVPVKEDTHLMLLERMPDGLIKHLLHLTDAMKRLPQFDWSSPALPKGVKTQILMELDNCRLLDCKPMSQYCSDISLAGIVVPRSDATWLTR